MPLVTPPSPVARLSSIGQRFFLRIVRPSGPAQRRVSNGRKTAFAALTGLLLTVMAAAVVAQQNLPIMGEPADAALSPTQEKRLGAQYMRQIRASLPLVQDVQANEFMQLLGDRLVLAAETSDFDGFTFFIIEDPQINAFAIPGGYIGINTGLIAAMDNEEQLASVVAHEIAHVTQRHHARSFATNSRSSLGAAATILAAILIGQSSAEAGQAALAAGLAANQQTSINFTRSNEVEADRIGIEILANADFDARAMAETFNILRRKNSLNTSGTVLEYLRTHPLDNNRIAEATDRASTKPIRERIAPLEFDLFKARLSVITASDSAQMTRLYKSQNERYDDVASTYALALLAQRDNRMDEARAYLARLNTKSQLNPFVELLRADIDSNIRSKEVDKRLAELATLYPDRYSIVEKRLETLVELRKLTQARDVAARYIRNSPDPDPLAWRQLASIQQSLNDEAGSHESLARYFEALDETSRAQSQLQLALREVAKGTQDEIRLSASLKNLREKAVRERQNR